MATTKLSRILVPTDFSETACHALRYASDLARGLGARLTVLYSDPFMPPVDYTASVGGWDEYTFLELKARAEEQLRRDAARTSIHRFPTTRWFASLRRSTAFWLRRGSQERD